MKFHGIESHTSKSIVRNLEVAELDEKWIARGATLKYYPLAIRKTKGSLLWDEDGNEYIDFLSSAAVYNIGNCHPRIREAVRAQLESNFNYTSAYFYQEKPARLAEKLAEITPGNFPKLVTLGFSGSDANDSAIKAARAYTGKKHIISFRGSYHGTTYGSLALTGIIDEGNKKCIFPLEGVTFVDFPDPLRNPWGINGYLEPGKLVERSLSQIHHALTALKGDVAGIIVEPIQGDSGAIIPPAGYMTKLKDLCTRYGLILIAEEIQTGMGRTGKWWGIENFDVEPDILVTGKALGGGMPISAVVGRKEIMASVPSPFFGFTHMGHAANSAAALAAIEVTEEEELCRKAIETGGYIAENFAAMARRYEILGDIRHRGLLFGVEVTDGGAETPDRDGALKICWRAWEKGLVMITFGKMGNVLRIAPPLNIEKALVDRAIEIIEESIKDFLEGRIPDEVVKYLQGW
ncbi:MAG: aspartate aminotransferase family protein [Synergistales bacterium]|nr:aspartate aminotransferase family protein [Synergistales bacterium]